MLVVLIVALTLALGIAIILFGTRRRARANEAWSTAADILGLELRPATWSQAGRISGTLSGHEVDVQTIRRDDSRSSGVATRYRVGYRDLGLGLKLRRQTAATRLARLFGARDIEVGDPEFDEAMAVGGRYPERVGAFLTPTLRLALHRLFLDHPGTAAGDTTLQWTKKGVETDTDAIVTTVRRFVEVAERMEDRTDRYATQDEALRTRLLGDVGEAARILAAARASGDTEARRTEGEVFYTAGRFDEAAEAFAAVRRDQPSDPWASRWEELARDRGAAPLPAPPPPAGAEPLDPDDLADEVFDRNVLGYDSTRLFEDRYRGRRVRWTGELQRARAYTTDLDFGDGPGVKAVFGVAVLSHDLFGGRDVDAVVALPPGAEGVLTDGRGEVFTFEGTLDRVDSLMRNFFLVDGSLVGD